MDEARAFGHRVQLLRLAQGLSRQSLADRARQLAAPPRPPLNAGTIWRVETGDHNPTQRTEILIARALGTTMAVLYGADPTLESLPAVDPDLARLWHTCAQLSPVRRRALLRFLEGVDVTNSEGEEGTAP